MKQLIDTRKWASKLKAQGSLALNKSSALQRYYVFAYRDQQMFCYLLREKSGVVIVENYAMLDIPTTVVTDRGVANTSELSELLSDVINIFAHESKFENPELVPAVIILEPSQFFVDSFLFNNPSKTLENQNLLDSQELAKLLKKSPYLENETIYQLFSLRPSRFISNRPELLNVMYTNKPFLDSWADVFKISRLKLAYLGPSSVPVVSHLAKRSKLPFVFVDTQCTSSRIYVTSEAQQITDTKFAYGHSQFQSKADNQYNHNRFADQLTRKIYNFSEAKDEQFATVFYDGFPQNSNADKLKGSTQCFSAINNQDNLAKQHSYLKNTQRSSLSDYLLFVAQLVVLEGI